MRNCRFLCTPKCAQVRSWPANYRHGYPSSGRKESGLTRALGREFFLLPQLLLAALPLITQAPCTSPLCRQLVWQPGGQAHLVYAHVTASFRFPHPVRPVVSVLIGPPPCSLRFGNGIGRRTHSRAGVGRATAPTADDLFKLARRRDCWPSAAAARLRGDHRAAG